MSKFKLLCGITLIAAGFALLAALLATSNKGAWLSGLGGFACGTLIVEGTEDIMEAVA